MRRKIIYRDDYWQKCVLCGIGLSITDKGDKCKDHKKGVKDDQTKLHETENAK